MSMSGVTVCDECVETFTDLKMKKVNRYATFRISDDKKNIVCDPDRPPMPKSDDADKDFEDFKGHLPPNEPRYCVYDFSFDTTDGTTARKQNKIVFIPWTPEDSTVKDRMLYASSKDALKKKLVGIHTECQACELGDLEFDTVKEKCATSK